MVLTFFHNFLKRAPRDLKAFIFQVQCKSYLNKEGTIAPFSSSRYAERNCMEYLLYRSIFIIYNDSSTVHTIAWSTTFIMSNIMIIFTFTFRVHHVICFTIRTFLACFISNNILVVITRTTF